MINVRSISKSYGATQAVRDISFQVARGEIVGLLGPNGAGKSTTLKMLAGYLAPDAGSVTVDDIDMADQPIEIKRRIGYLPETNPLYPDLTVREFLEFAAAMQDVPREEIERSSERVIKMCRLEGKEDQEIGTLSKGYRQRVGLAQALIHQPNILLLDEPTEGLDPTQRLEIRDLIKSLGAERTVIISSHVLPEIEATCDRVLIINAGALAASGTSAELRQRAATQNVITMRVEGPLDAIRQNALRVEGVERVLSAAESGGTVTIELECDSTFDIRKKLVHWVSNNSWELVEISLKETSLEEVFASVTR